MRVQRRKQAPILTVGAMRQFLVGLPAETPICDDTFTTLVCEHAIATPSCKQDRKIVGETGDLVVVKRLNPLQLSK